MDILLREPILVKGEVNVVLGFYYVNLNLSVNDVDVFKYAD